MSKQAFNNVAVFVRYRIKRTQRPLFVRFVSNHRCHSALSQTITITFRRTAFIPQNLLRTLPNTSRRCPNRHLIHDRKNQRIVARLTSANKCRYRNYIVVTHSDDLGRPTAFRLANSVVGRFIRYFFFVKAPAADLWTLTMVPSTENADQSMCPSASKRIKSLSSIKSHVPSNCQSR